MRYSIKLSYNGSAFCGWQRQPDDPSVQQTLEEALSRLLGGEVGVTGAGRTDTGVNACGYIAHFDAPETGRGPIDCAQLRYKLNAILPRTVTVHEVTPVEDGFHARFGAARREYTYFLHRVKDPFIDAFSYFYGYPDLDVDAMNRAASLLIGTHDFSCFEKTGADNKTSICTVSEAEWRVYTPSHAAIMSGLGDSTTEGCYLYFRIAADRFLRNMVRATVGTLLEVGRGKRSVESISALLESGTRCDAGESVPGKALFLSRVDY